MVRTQGLFIAKGIDQDQEVLPSLESWTFSRDRIAVVTMEAVQMSLPIREAILRDPSILVTSVCFIMEFRGSIYLKMGFKSFFYYDLI